MSENEIYDLDISIPAPLTRAQQTAIGMALEKAVRFGAEHHDAVQAVRVPIPDTVAEMFGDLDDAPGFWAIAAHVARRLAQMLALALACYGAVEFVRHLR